MRNYLVNFVNSFLPIRLALVISKANARKDGVRLHSIQEIFGKAENRHNGVYSFGVVNGTSELCSGAWRCYIE